MSESFELQMRAISAAQELMTQAQEVRRLYRLANMPLPPAIATMLGDEGATLVRRETPKRPQEWREGWVWVPVNALSPGTVALAVLAGSGELTPAKMAFEQARKISDHVVEGSFYNAGQRLAREGLIKKSKHGWSLTARASAPVIHDGFAWGPADQFNKWELAGYRRLLIIDILRDQGGLMAMQIVTALEKSGCQAPHDKDTVKSDIIAMQGERLIKKVSNTKKWVLTNE